MPANRTVKVSLVSEVNGYIAGMDAAAARTRNLGTEAEKLAQKRDAINTLGQGLLTMGTVAAAGVGIAIAKFAEFDAAMSGVQAATHESTENMGLLRQAAIDAGASTVFSATESANAVEELSKAGLTTADILSGGLTGSLDLASAGELGVARAAEIASTALQQFQLDGSQTSHVADVLAAGAGKAMGSVEDLANGLKFVGPVAQSMGVSIEETTGVLALFAQQGIIGEQAGTSLRGVFASLTAPSGQAAKEIERLGLSLYDSQGNFLGLENAAGELSRAYGSMDMEARNASMGIIFGRETITAATALYQAGAEGVDEWTTAVDDSGYAAETARLKLDNLKGDVEALGGALDTALIQTGSGANDALRFLTQAATDSIDGFNGLHPAVQATSLGLGATVAAAGTAGGAFLLAVPKVVEFRQAIDQMGPGAQRAGRAIVGLGKVAGVAAGALAAAQVLDKLTASSDATAKSVEETTAALLDMQTGDLFGGLGSDVNSYADGLNLLVGGSFDAKMERFGSTLNGIFAGGSLSDQVLETRNQFDAMGESLAQLTSSGEGERAAQIFDDLVKAAEAEGYSREQLTELMPAYATALAGANNEQELAAETSGIATEGLNELAGGAEGAAEEITDLAAAIEGFGSFIFDVRDKTREYEAAIDDLAESLEKNGTTLDVTTEKGRANESALDALATSTLNLAAATLEQTQSQEEASAVIQTGRDKLIEILGQFGITGQAASDYADKLGLIPENVSTAATTPGMSEAIQRAEDLARALKNIPGTTNAYIWTHYRQTGAPAYGDPGQGLGVLKPDGKADGGAITGVGGPREDNIPIWASVGEHMLDAEDVALMGGQAAVYAFREDLKKGKGGYASGGAVHDWGAATFTPAPAPAPQITVTAPSAPAEAGPRIGSVTFQQSQGSPQEAIEALDFYLRSMSRGGR